VRKARTRIRRVVAAGLLVALAVASRGSVVRADVAAAAAWRVASGISTAFAIDSTIYVGGAFTQLYTPSTAEDQFYDPITGQVRAECARSTSATRSLFGYPDNQGGLLVPVQVGDTYADSGGSFVPPDDTTIVRIAPNCLWDRQFAAGTVDPADPFNTTIGPPARAGNLVVATNAIVNFTTGFLQAQAAAYSAVTGARTLFRNDYQLGFGGQRVSELGVLGASATRVIVRVRTGSLGTYTLGALDPATLDLFTSSSTLVDESLGARSWIRGNTLFRLRPSPSNALEAYDLTTLAPKAGWTAPVVPSLTDIEVVGNRVFLAARVVNGQTLSAPAAVLASSGAIDTSWAPPALTRRVPDPNGVPYQPVLTALATDGVRIYVAGDFERVGGTDRDGVAAIGAASAALDGWDPAPFLVSPLDATTAALLMTRPTGSNRATRRYLAAVDRATGVPTAWDPNDAAKGLLHTPGPVSVVAADATHVYFANAASGEVLRADRTTAVVDQTWKVTVTRADGTPGAVSTMAIGNGLVYLGGDFDRLTGVNFGVTPRRWLAAIGTDGRLSTWAPVLDGNTGTTWLRTLLVDGRTVYLGGDFTSVNGVYLLGYAAVDGLSGAVTQPLMYVAGDNTSVYGLATDGTQIFVAGVAFGAPLVGAASVPDAQLTQYGPTNGVVPTSAAFVAGRLYAGQEYDPDATAPTTRADRWGKVVADAQGLVHLLADGSVEYFPALPGNPPGAPTLAATSFGNTVSIAWTPDAAAGVPSSYTLYAGNAPGVYNLAAIPLRGTTTFSATVPTGLYYLSVVARNGYGTSALSNEVAVQAGCVAPPPAPTGLGFTKFGGAVSIAWNAASTAIGYQLEAGTVAGTANLGAIPLGNVTRFTTAAPLGVYYVRVRAANACGAGPASSEIAVNLDGSTPLPQTPTGLVASVTGRTVTFGWNPAVAGGLASGYQIEAGVTPGGVIAVLPTGATTLSVANAPSGTFYVRVRAVNATGASAPTADITVAIP